MVYGMALCECHCKRYSLTDMAWYMLWPGGHDMVYVAEITRCILWPGGHGMVYGMA